MPINPFDNPEAQIPNPYSDRPLETNEGALLTETQKMRKLLEMAVGLPPFLRVVETVLDVGQLSVVTIDAPFTHYCVYNTCDATGFMRIGPNLQSVPETGSLYLGRNGKVIFPATARYTAIYNPSPVPVDAFVVGFNRSFDIFF